MGIPELYLNMMVDDPDKGAINYGWWYRQIHKRSKDIRYLRRNKAVIHEGERNTKGYRLACSDYARLGDKTDPYAMSNYVVADLGKKTRPGLSFNESRRLDKSAKNGIQKLGHSKVGADPFGTIENMVMYIEAHKHRLEKNGRIGIFTFCKWQDAGCWLQSTFPGVMAERIRKAIKWVIEGMLSKVICRIKNVAKKIAGAFFGPVQNMALPIIGPIINNGRLVNQPLITVNNTGQNRYWTDNDDRLDDRTEIFDRNILIIPTVRTGHKTLNIMKEAR